MDKNSNLIVETAYKHGWDMAKEHFTKWRNIETAPKTGELILVYWLGKIQMAFWEEKVKNWQEWPDGDFPVCLDEITHWLPLPEVPHE